MKIRVKPTATLVGTLALIASFVAFAPIALADRRERNVDNGRGAVAARVGRCDRVARLAVVCCRRRPFVWRLAQSKVRRAEPNRSWRSGLPELGIPRRPLSRCRPTRHPDRPRTRRSQRCRARPPRSAWRSARMSTRATVSRDPRHALRWFVDVGRGGRTVGRRNGCRQSSAFESRRGDVLHGWIVCCRGVLHVFRRRCASSRASSTLCRAERGPRRVFRRTAHRSMRFAAPSDSTTCVAVGGWFNSSSNFGEALIDTYSGGTWSVISEPPVPWNPVAYSYTLSNLSSVACPSSTSCVSVGQYGASNGCAGLIETFASGSWAATPAPLPSNAGSSANANLVSVGCPTDGSCVAVGTYDETLGATEGLIDTLGNGSWAANGAPTPSASDSSANLQSAECESASARAVVGKFEDSSGNVSPLADFLLGGVWNGAQARVPTNAASPSTAALNTMACPSAASSVAVGTYTDSSGNSLGMLDSYAFSPPVPPTTSTTTQTETNTIPPRISGLTPSEGFASSKLVLKGSGFCTVRAVYFGNRPAPRVLYGSQSELVATIPPGHGRVAITVRNAGSSTVPDPFASPSRTCPELRRTVPDRARSIRALRP